MTSMSLSKTRDQSRCAPSQWEVSWHCNNISHWLGAYLDWSLKTAVPKLQTHLSYHCLVLNHWYYLLWVNFMKITLVVSLLKHVHHRKPQHKRISQFNLFSTLSLMCGSWEPKSNIMTVYHLAWPTSWAATGHCCNKGSNNIYGKG